VLKVKQESGYQLLRQRLVQSETSHEREIDDHNGQYDESASYCAHLTRWMQNTSYQIMAFTFWDSMMAGFKPGRLRALQLLDIHPNDKVLLVGEGSGLDFECLPDNIDKHSLVALDYSSEMVRQSKLKANQWGIPEESCIIGDAQSLPFETEKFDKILFPLSLASIPNPTLALKEAERVLAAQGKIVIFEKLVDDNASVSFSRRILNRFTAAIFADINRNLTQMLGKDSPLMMTHYESVENRLEGLLAKNIDRHYRIALVVRKADFSEENAVSATLA